MKPVYVTIGFLLLAPFQVHYAATLDDATITLGNNVIVIPVIEDYPRLDGKNSDLDSRVNTMASGARNRVVALYGPESDLGLIMDGRLPVLSRTITIQSALAFEDKTMSPQDFASFKEMLKKDLKNADKSIERLLEEIEISSSDAVSKQRNIDTIVQYGNVVLLGILEDTPDSLSQSILAKVRAESETGTSELLQASSIALVHIQGKLLTIYVSAVYNSHEDLQWTRKMALSVRDRLIEANK